MTGKGGYKIVDLKKIDVTDNAHIDGIFEDIEASYGKAIQLAHINIDGVEKKDAFITFDVEDAKYVTIVYGYKIIIDADDDITATPVEEGGAVDSVNGKTGEVVLTADDIDATNTQSIQANLERIDERIDDLDTDKLDATKQAIAGVGGLVVPTSAPTDTSIVAVETDREQAQIYLGTGLDLGNDTSPYNLNVVGIGETRVGNEMKLWVGSQAQYEAITTKSNTTIYYIVG